VVLKMAASAVTNPDGSAVNTGGTWVNATIDLLKLGVRDTLE
jgi:hypothetical protein